MLTRNRQEAGMLFLIRCWWFSVKGNQHQGKKTMNLFTFAALFCGFILRRHKG